MFTHFLSRWKQRVAAARRKRVGTHHRRRFAPASLERLEDRALLASLSGIAFADANSNGVREAGEAALAGITVYLDQNRSGVFDLGETSTTTAANGGYAFNSLPAGNYTVRQVTPPGFEQTGPIVHAFYYATTRATSGAPRQLVRVDDTTGQLTIVGSLGIARNLNGLVRTNDGSLFAIAGEGTGDAFYSVNPVTGAATLVGNTGMEVAFGLAYDPSSDTIFGIGQVAAGLRGLVTFDRVTGRATAVSAASAAEPSSTNGLAFDPVQNRVLAYNFNDGQIYGFNPVTGQRTTLAKVASGLSASLAFADGLLVTKRDFSGMINEFITIHPNTGQINSLFFASVGVVFESLEFVDLPDFAHTVSVGAVQNVGGLDFGNLRVNSPPSADAGGPYVVREGQGVMLNAGASTDPDGDELTFAWDLDGDGQFDDAAGAVVALSWSELSAAGIADDGSYPVSVRVSDGLFTADAASTVIVQNVAPAIGSLTVSAAKVGDAVPGRPVSLAATFTDPGSSDSHDATIDWGDGVKTAGVISAGKISASHVYRTGGVFFISVSLKDDDGGGDAESSVAYVTGFRIEKGVLEIVGTARADSVVVAAPQSNSAQVQANFLPGRRAAFKPASVSKIEVYLGAGNDRFTLHRNYKQPLLVVGGAGADEINSGSGRSVLIGGAGADQLNGGANQDLLIAGTTAFDGNVLALRGILAEWSSGRSLKDRVANLYNGSGAGPRANGNNFLTVGSGGTVSHDSASDTLRSGNSTDWLFYDPRRDRIRGRATDDLFANNLDELLGRRPRK